MFDSDDIGKGCGGLLGATNRSPRKRVADLEALL